MSNLNDNNLDDLLRRAAEKYPLRTDSADFTKLVADLEKDPSLILPPVSGEDRRRRRRFFWLFLLLPLGGGAYFAWHTTTGRAHVTEITQGKQTVPGGESTAAGQTGKSVGGGVNKTEGVETITGGGKTIEGGDNKTASGGKTVTGGDKIPGEGDSKIGEGGKTVTGGDKTSGEGDSKIGEGGKTVTSGGKTPGEGDSKIGEGGKTVTGGDKTPGEGDSKIGEGGKSVTSGGKTPGEGDDEIGGGRKTDDTGKSNGGQHAGRKEVGVSTRRDAGVAAGRERRGHNRNGQPDGVASPDWIGQPEPDKTGNLAGSNTVPARVVDRKVPLAATRGTVDVNIPVKAGVTGTAQQKASQKNKIKLQKPKPSFYVGILGSPDLSMIKFQSVKSVGYNLGLLLGYSFNNRWAIETGLYYDRKKYYTDGEYFSKEKQPRLNYYNIKTADGFCNMWEIPLNVRYNFSRGDKMKWFATGGFSNYLMTGETYTFTGTSSMDPNWRQGTWSYKTPYKYWFSILDFSVGFEQRLGKIGNLRLEPYVRVPLTGVGTGNLSIMSAGLNIGITRRIW